MQNGMFDMTIADEKGKDVRELSDELCKEYGLTVIEKPKGKTPRNIYFAEKRGEPTKYNLMRQAKIGRAHV